MKSRAFSLLLLGAFAAATAVFPQQKDTSKQSVEKRLGDVQKGKSSLTVEKAIEALAAAGSFGQVALSPDGKKIAWVEKLRSKEGVETGNSAILASSAAGQTPFQKITASPTAATAESDIAWAPDNRRVAFL